MRLNFGGYKWLPVDGYGRMSLKVAQALMRRGHEVYPFEIEALDKPAWYLRAQGFDFSRMTVCLMPPHHMKAMPGRNIAWTMHESTKLPSGWANHVNAKAQWLFVPHEWLVEVFEDAGVRVPIEVVPGGIDPEECYIPSKTHNGPYTFGCLADRGARKGYDLVWTAFYKAFDARNKDVRLLVKCRPGSLPYLDFSYSRDERMTLWRADVESVADVFMQMDAFIFPSRCEGYGMPPREAAACGVPTVVTRWSALDDETECWALPLDNYTLIDSHMQDCGGLWAEPDLDEIVERMRWLYEHQDEAKRRAATGAQWLRDNRTYAHAADKLVDAIGKHIGAPQ